MPYRKESNRLPERDYRNEWWYFVTICIKDFKCLFGEVIEWEVVLNELGKIVEDEILNTEKIRENIEIDQFVIMPNHIHMIIFINDSVETRCGVSNNLNRFANGKSLRNCKKFWWLNKNSLWLIINLIKWQITKRCKKTNPAFSRQSNYYEHIIRNDKDLERIQNYIINNPIKRKNDEYYTS